MRVAGTVAVLLVAAGLAACAPGSQKNSYDYEHMPGSGNHTPREGPGVLDAGHYSKKNGGGMLLYSDDPEANPVFGSLKSGNNQGQQRRYPSRQGYRPRPQGPRRQPTGYAEPGGAYGAPPQSEQQRFREYQQFKRYEQFQNAPESSSEKQRFRDWQQWQDYQRYKQQSQSQNQ